MGFLDQAGFRQRIAQQRGLLQNQTFPQVFPAPNAHPFFLAPFNQLPGQELSTPAHSQPGAPGIGGDPTGLGEQDATEAGIAAATAGMSNADKGRAVVGALSTALGMLGPIGFGRATNEDAANTGKMTLGQFARGLSEGEAAAENDGRGVGGRGARGGIGGSTADAPGNAGQAPGQAPGQSGGGIGGRGPGSGIGNSSADGPGNSGDK